MVQRPTSNVERRKKVKNEKNQLGVKAPVKTGMVVVKVAFNVGHPSAIELHGASRFRRYKRSEN